MEKSLNEKVERIVFSVPFNDILDIENYLLRITCIKKYEEEQEKLLKAYPNFANYFDSSKSLEYNYYNLEQMTSEIISEYLFPGDKVIYFPIIETFKASREYTCAITGAIINKGSYYEQFKAILNNLSKNKSYVSPKIKYECGSNIRIPKSLHEFEDFCYRLKHSYELGLDEEYNIYNTIGGIKLNRIKYKNQKIKRS